MTELNHQIQLALRTAAGHARAASDTLSAADKTFEMKMKSAGAAVYEAWGLAVRAQPEYQGRKIDDKALERLYAGTTPRPWWDRHLEQIKVEGKPAGRDWAKRTMQWHLDPDAARARRLQAVVRSEGHNRRVKEAAARGARGVQTPQGDRGPSTKEMREVGNSAREYHPSPVELASGYGGAKDGVVGHNHDEINRLLDRARKAVRWLSDPIKLAEAESLIRDLVDQLEGL